MMDSLKGEGFTEAEIKGTEKALNDPTTHDGNTLGRLIDAVTLAAQDKEDIYAQQAMERGAWRVMKNGLSEAQNGRLTAKPSKFAA